MSIPKFYSVTDVNSIPISERDVDGVYFLRKANGFDLVRVADTPNRDFVYTDLSWAYNAGTVAEANAGVEISPMVWSPNVLKDWIDGKIYVIATHLNTKADKTTTITGTGLIEGGGSLDANRTLDLTTTTKANIAKGVTANSWGDHATEGYIKNLREEIQIKDSPAGISVSAETDCIICTVSGGEIAMPNPTTNAGRVIKFTCTFEVDFVDLYGYPINMGGADTISQLGGRTSGSLNTPRSLEIISDGTEWVLIHRGL